MTSPAIRARYLTHSVSTASPARLLVMLYERLVLDLNQAEATLKSGDRSAASAYLLHAQEIILELRTTLNESVWDGAAGLAQIYGFVLSELITANVNAEPGRVADCRGLIEPLLDAWRQAAVETTSRVG